MTDTIQQIKYYFEWQLKARHWKGYGIHSPYVYEFTREVLADRKTYPEYKDIDRLYRNLQHSDTVLPIEDLGTPSKVFPDSQRKVRDLVKHSSVQPPMARLLFRISRHVKPALTIELGTSIGLSALSLAKGNPKGRVVSLEGNASLCRYAEKLFEKEGLNNVEVKEGLFDNIIPSLADTLPVPDLVYIDGNHEEEATKRYFEHFASRMKTGIILFDDIHWSPGMHRAWKAIAGHAKSIVSIDLYDLGIVILDTRLTPGEYRIRH